MSSSATVWVPILVALVTGLVTVVTVFITGRNNHTLEREKFESSLVLQIIAIGDPEKAESNLKFLVSAGHIHNYERAVRDDVVYLVSGGGGAVPYYVERTTGDMYQSVLFPNFHYVKLTLEKDRVHGSMYRVSDPEGEALKVDLKDSFDIPLRK